MSTEQIRESFEAWYMAKKASSGGMLHNLGPWDAWQAALNQPAAPAPNDAESVMALAKALCYADTKSVLQAETEDWDLRYREKETAEAALKSAVTAMEQERDDLNRRCSEYMEAGNQQALKIAALEAQLAAQPVGAPLTYKELMDVARATGWPPSMISAFVQAKLEEFARAIERAHGINAAAQGEVKS